MNLRVKGRRGHDQLNIRKSVGNGGFSLIEVIIAIVILALITIPLMNYFTDSLRYSAKMGKEQKATLTAQEISEALKAADHLIEQTVDSSTGTVTYNVVNLPTFPTDPDDPASDTLTDISVDGSGFNTASNPDRGEFIITAKKDNFDVQITLSTDSAANDADRTLIRGIDSVTDVLILERDQQSEAMVYYTAANAEYCAEDPDNRTRMTQDQIRGNITRTIHVDVIKNASDYTVQAYYDYRCSGLQGAGSAALEFKSSYLVDVKLTSLENLFFLYDCIVDGSGNLKDDVIEFSVPSSSSDPNLSLGFYLIPQNLPDAGSSYTMEINGCSGTDSRLTFRSNYRTSDTLKVGGVDVSDKKALTEEGKPVRVLIITTDIYELDHAAGDEPLASMKATKGE